MKHLISAGAAMALLTLSWGQEAPYTTEIISQSYAPLEEYSVLELDLGWDDPEELLPIPFDMVVWGDTCSLVATSNVGEMILCIGNGNHLIAPVFADICDVSPADSTGQDVSEVRHALEGVAPNRIFKLEYHNVGFYPEVYSGDSAATATQRATYQVWLYESGTIAFHYGPSTITDPMLVADGFINSAGLIGNFDPYSYSGSMLVAEGPADAPEFQDVSDFYSWFYGNGEGWGMTWPTEGTGYLFNPDSPAGISAPLATRLTAFPNPAANHVTVRLQSDVPQTATWLDGRGREAGTALLRSGNNRLDVSALVPGAYVLRLEDGTAVRVTVQR